MSCYDLRASNVNRTTEGFRVRSYGKPIGENFSFMRGTGKASGALLWTGLEAKNLTSRQIYGF